MKPPIILLAASCCLAVTMSWGQQAANSASHQRLIEQFMATTGGQSYWYGPNSQARQAILQLASSVRYYGLQWQEYDFPVASDKTPAESDLHKRETQFTGSLLSLASDMYCGAHIGDYIKNDEVSGKFTKVKDSVLLQWAKDINPATNINDHLAKLIPADAPYHTLAQELQRQIDSGNVKKQAQLITSINLYRWIKHFGFDKYIIVNIPAATLYLYNKDSVTLNMKVVAGKPSTRTPRFASWCNKVIFYPYWNVPGDIARKELLPTFKRNPAKVAAMNMQLLNSASRVVDPYSLNWASYNRNYFPYLVRQCTGCDNALGVIKFNLTDPFSVYMHDTNNKPAFASDYRYLSHGCIRLSQPLELGNALLENKLDTTFLRACLKGQEPVEQMIKQPVPVFVVYMTAWSEGDSIKYMKDIYHLNK